MVCFLVVELEKSLSATEALELAFTLFIYYTLELEIWNRGK